MKRTSMISSAVLVLGLSVAVAPAAAQGRGRGAGGAMHGPPSHAQSGAPMHQPQGQPSQQGTMRGNHPARSPQGHGAIDHLEHHPQQAERLQQLLPPGTDVHQAAEGFQNWGRFVAAAHVSKNLNIPFDQLKARTTGPDSVSLGKAIHELRPDLSKSEVKEAVKEAKRAEKEERKAEKNEPSGS